jgi:GR25 family glycosyltransferase involved in LPS biosynthesis
MEASEARRASFAEKFAMLGFSSSPGSVHWMLGVNGSSVPQQLFDSLGHITHQQGMTPGALGCFLSHFLAIDQHMKQCPDCDMVVFEDDVSFHPDFRELWGDFLSGLPDRVVVDDTSVAPGHLHIGGDGFWIPPVAKGRSYYQGGWVSRTWGYVLRASALQSIVNLLRDVTPAADAGIDQVLGAPDVKRHISIFSPKLPLVVAFGLGSGTKNNNTNFVDGVEAIGDNDVRMQACWYAGQRDKHHRYGSRYCGWLRKTKRISLTEKKWVNHRQRCITCPQEINIVRQRLRLANKSRRADALVSVPR